MDHKTDTDSAADALIRKLRDILDEARSYIGAPTFSPSMDSEAAVAVDLADQYLAASASLAASAGSEPVAWIWKYADGEEEVVFVRPERVKDMHPDTHDMPSKITPLYTHPSPPEGTGWLPIETAPKERGAQFIGLTTTGRAVTAEPMYCVYDGPAEFRGWLEVERGSIVSVDLKGWMPLPKRPAPPASEAKERGNG